MREAIKAGLSAVHVPNEVFEVPAMPSTRSGKKMELSMEKASARRRPSHVMNRGAMGAWMGFWRLRQAGRGGW